MTDVLRLHYTTATSGTHGVDQTVPVTDLR